MLRFFLRQGVVGAAHAGFCFRWDDGFSCVVEQQTVLEHAAALLPAVRAG